MHTSDSSSLGHNKSRVEADIRGIRERQWKGDVDPEYARLVSGKTVAIVGPARTVLGTKHRRRIEAHDIVVRFNDVFDFLSASPDLADDIGTRVDILYCNQAILNGLLLARLGDSPTGLVDTFNRAGLKYVVCTNNSLSFTIAGEPRPTCEPQDRRVIADVTQALDRHGSTMRMRVVYAASKMLAQWLQGNWPRTGLVGILDLLTFDVRRLFITGMTFYHGGGHLLTPESTQLHPRKHRDGTWAQSPSGRGHDSYLELEVMKVLAQGFGDVLDMDDALAALLSA